MRPYVETFKTFMTSIEIIFQLAADCRHHTIQHTDISTGVSEKNANQILERTRRKSAFLKIMKKTGSQVIGFKS